MSGHYDKKYFDWQKECGIIGGQLNKFKFEKYIENYDITLMDFGCGGGFLLDNFNVKDKIGFDINPYALDECNNKNIKTFNNLDNILDDSIDIIISNHAFEHIPDPYNILKILYKKLKINGKIIIVVPCEQPNEISFNFNKNDFNKHLFNWTPMTLANLLDFSGFHILEADTIRHQWCPDFKTNFNHPSFHFRCHQFAIKNGNYQVRVVAQKI